MRTKKLSVFLVLVFIVVMLVPAAVFGKGGPSNPNAKANEGKAPLIGLDNPNAIKGAYIVSFKKDSHGKSVDNAKNEAVRQGAKIGFTYNNAVRGFSAQMNEKAVEALRNNPNVAYIEADYTVQLKDTFGSWGLDRIDQRNLPLSNSFTPNANGAGVHVYVVDTGIRTTHNEFSNLSIGNGWDTIDNDSDYNDCHGHGTHVAGTVAGKTYGIARNVTLHGVRVLNCQGSGTTSQVIAGIDWVAQNAVLPAVANMSLGGGFSQTENNAVQAAIDAGITFVVAAGNETTDACSKSPASAPNAITVAASDSSDTIASFSNYGSCVDIFAPGVSITSATSDSNSATATWNGTSMASPHVAGVVALYLGQNPNATTSQVTAAILDNATANKISNPKGSPNKLLYWGDYSGGNPDPDPTPTPDPTPSCSNTTYTGSLSNGGSAIQPNGTYYYGTGTQEGILDGPSGTDFDLYLYKWNGWSWSQVAVGYTSSSHEEISYNGNGYFYWKVKSYSGSGSYSLCATP